jgi:hypothetical protein
MNPAYKQLHQQADHLFHKYLDIVDDKTDGMADGCQHEIREVIEDIEMSRAPRAIEDRIKRIEQMLEKVRSEQSHMMTPQDAAFLIHEYEKFRAQLHHLPNY